MSLVVYIGLVPKYLAKFSKKICVAIVGHALTKSSKDLQPESWYSVNFGTAVEML